MCLPKTSQESHLTWKECTSIFNGHISGLQEFQNMVRWWYWRGKCCFSNTSVSDDNMSDSITLMHVTAARKTSLLTRINLGQNQGTILIRDCSTDGLLDNREIKGHLRKERRITNTYIMQVEVIYVWGYKFRQSIICSFVLCSFISAAYGLDLDTEIWRMYLWLLGKCQKGTLFLSLEESSWGGVWNTTTVEYIRREFVKS